MESEVKKLIKMELLMMYKYKRYIFLLLLFLVGPSIMCFMGKGDASIFIGYWIAQFTMLWIVALSTIYIKNNFINIIESLPITRLNRIKAKYILATIISLSFIVISIIFLIISEIYSVGSVNIKFIMNIVFCGISASFIILTILIPIQFILKKNKLSIANSFIIFIVIFFAGIGSSFFENIINKLTSSLQGNGNPLLVLGMIALISILVYYLSYVICKVFVNKIDL
ncbi:ABC-2 transporter permease [Hathewaya limosa]|uniref:ABC-2 transporter permease n=1 Tax=Hathewaya limosa TaxID=1536 RepID=A0ABU0JVB3_HATLI|nr:ABC-2 transporter permease [Hathewaya limosa]MDQ0480068.1 hypothetical protein [Hathewaya limosa]